MGLFESICKKCSGCITYFILEGDGVVCKHCGVFNTKSDLHGNEIWTRNPDLKLIYDRVMKISKIKKLIELKNRNH